MKLAFSASGCPGWDFAQILLRAKQYGFDALTARHYDGLFSLEWEKHWNPTLPEPEEAFPAFCACMRG